MVDFSKYQKKQKTEELESPKPKIQKIPKKVLPVKNIEIEKIEPKTPEKSVLNENIIDFNALANTSDFKRLIYRAITDKVWRGTNKGLEIELKSKLRKLKGAEKS